MKTFTYPLLARIVYRWANIPVTILLLFYLIIYLIAIEKEWTYILPALLNLTIIYVLNRHYLKSYRLFPYKITIDNEKMICEDFMFSNKQVTIYHSDIDKITGSIFSGNKGRPLYIHDEKKGVTIGLRVHLQGYNEVLTTVLSNIKQGLYESLLENIKEFNTSLLKQREKRISKKTKKPVK